MPSAAWPAVTTWPGGSAWPSSTVWPPLAFPATVVPAVWFDGNQQAFADLAGTLPVSSGLIRRINEPAAQGSSWQTPTDPERPFRDSNAVRYECIGSAGGYEMTRPVAGGIPQNACTLVCSVMLRDNAYAGPVAGLIRSEDLTVGIWTAGTAIFIYYGGGSQWNPTTLALVQGVQNTMYVEYTSVGITVTVYAAGSTKTESFVVALSASAVAGSYRMGVTGAGYIYGSVSQCLLVPRNTTVSEKAAVVAWVMAQSLAPAYPLERALIAYVGDSITRATGANYSSAYPFLALSNIRSTKPLTENCDTAVGGAGVTGMLAPVGIGQSGFLRASAFYSAGRAKNIMVMLIGTNDAANGNSAAYILTGSGAAAGSGIYPACDYARAQGWKVVLLTIGPRSDAMAVSQLTYNTVRAAVNTDIAANWPNHADAFVDTRVITNFGADGDSDNVTFYSADKVHPNNAGHALLEPSVRAAVLSLL